MEQLVTEPNKIARYKWRVVDIVTAAVLGVLCGLLFIGWNVTGGGVGWSALDAVTPGLGGLMLGIWLLGGLLGGAIIRKPGAALLVELMAAVVEMAIGSIWGMNVVFSGIVQGLACELIFLIFGYKRFNLVVLMLAGGVAGALEWCLELFTSANFAKSFSYNITYLATMIISGVLLGGLVTWLIIRALVPTGVLTRFSAGAEHDLV